MVESVFTGPRSYVEIVAGCRRDGQHATTEVGVSIVDTTAGRVLVSPSRAFDGEWVSTFSPGTPFAIAVAIEQLTASLPDGQWFPGQRLSRDFSAQSAVTREPDRERARCPRIGPSDFEGPVTSGAVMPIVRVAILADSRLTEMALPAELPLREILPAVQRLVVPAASNGDGGALTRCRRAASQLSLAPIGGAPFSLDASLDTVGVVDGDLLALQPVPTGPAAPGIVEDIADAAMIFSTSRLKPWGTTHIQRGALAAAIAVGVGGNRSGGHLPGSDRRVGRTGRGQRDRGARRVGARC